MFIIALIIIMGGLILWIIRQNRLHEKKQKDWVDAVQRDSVKRK